MSEGSDDPRLYSALMIPAEALEKGGVEILRAGLVEDMLNVHAVPAFDDPKHWGDVLAEIAEALADLYPEQPGALQAIQERFLIECGRDDAPPAPATKAVRRPTSKPARKAAPKSKPAKAAMSKSAKSKPRASEASKSKAAPRRSRAASTTTRKTKRKR